MALNYKQGQRDITEPSLAFWYLKSSSNLAAIDGLVLQY